ncbi:universal stress protein [Saccharopolyspora sp. 6M]|uniref:universal stress protein n=1 Tax=Saccharopolyspora sp. 6M TaxID=2877237 RepID=UPI001CD63181|nr:universal stress protein [Saccharopolyspora sp. 6M]MCA1226377.1 universal stress protein [Saccharopolyspora sp. 6M]
MSELGTGPLVVGVDGSGTARGAVRWAAAEAARRRRALRIVYADVFALPALPGIPGVRWSHAPRAEVRAEVRKWLADAAEIAQRQSPDLEVRTESVPGSPASVLIEESVSAGLVVVGDRGLGGFSGLLAGSVAVAVAAHGHCATVVVRGRGEPADGPVVVGLAGSRQAPLLLEHGFAAAAAHDVPLHVVHTWNLVGVDSKWMRVGLAADEIEEGSHRLLAELISGRREHHPDVRVQRFVAKGSPAATLLEHAAGATLVVVGTRGRGGFTGMLLGSTSQALIHHAPCPVLIARTPKR